MQIARVVLAPVAAILLWVALPAAAAVTLPPAQAFFDRPLFGGAVISPSGKFLACLTAMRGAAAS